MQKFLSKYFGNIELAVLSIFIVLLPFIYSSKLLDNFLYSRIFALSVVLIVVCFLLFVKALKGKTDLSISKVEGWVFGLGLFFFILHIVSSFGAINGKEATFHTLKQGALMLYFFIVYILVRENSKGKEVIIKSFILSSFLFLCIGVYQLTKVDFSVFLNAKSHYGYYLTQALWDVKSTLANKNPFSSFLYLALPFTIFGIVSFKRLWRIISVLTLLLNLVFIALMVSKTVWFSLLVFIGIGLILLFVYIFYLMPRQSGKKLSSLQNIIVIAVPLSIILSSVLFVIKSDSGFANVIKDKVLQVVNPDAQLSIKSKDNPSSMEMRVIAWSKTFNMIEEHPFLGVGPGNWRICFPKYGLDEFDENLRNGSMHFQRTHNDFLWIAAEVGVLGLLIYLSIFLFVLYTALINFLKSKNNDKKLLNGLLLASFFGYMLILAVSFSRERVPHNIIYLAMFAVILFDRYGNEKIKRKKAKKGTIFFASVLILLFTLFNSYVTWDFYKGDKAALAITYFKDVRKNWKMVYSSATKADVSFYTLDPFGTPLDYYKGSYQHQRNNIKQAHSFFLKAYQVHPYHILVLNNLGTSYDMEGEHDKAIEFYEKALEISPRYAEPLINIATVYYNKKDPKKALSYISKIPYSKNQSERYRKAVIAICQQYVIVGKTYTTYNRDAFVDWIQDENKIEASFVKFSQGDLTFDKILEEELKK